MIKKYSFIFLFTLAISTMYSQAVSDSAILGNTYANQVFYKLSDGTKTVASNTEWDLQFFSSLFSASIRVNSGMGVELYAAASTDTTNFATASLDTSTITRLRDGYASWEQDAFTSQGTGHPNYGWGIYTGVGNITGVKVYALKLSNGSFKKIWMKGILPTGEATISIANLDGSSMITKVLNRNTYSTKRHFYYDIENDSILDFEPAKGDWEIVFRKYEDVSGPSYYKVAGALTNNNIGVSQVNGVATATAFANWPSYPGDTSAINTIGHDWKSFNMTTFQYDVMDSLSYIVKDNAGNVYQLIFTGATLGSQGGKIFFTKELVSLVSIEEKSPVLNLGIFPNPTTSTLNINFELIDASILTQISLMDVNGRIVKSIANDFNTSGFNQLSVDVSDLTNGVYFLSVRAGDSILTKRVIKQ